MRTDRDVLRLWSKSTGGLVRGIQYMNLTEFRDLGLLQEMNRGFLHPHGLAIEMVVEDDLTVSGFGGVWDYRSSELGMLFGAGMIDPEKAMQVLALLESHRAARERRWGGIIQPPGQ